MLCNACDGSSTGERRCGTKTVVADVAEYEGWNRKGLLQQAAMLRGPIKGLLKVKERRIDSMGKKYVCGRAKLKVGEEGAKHDARLSQSSLYEQCAVVRGACGLLESETLHAE